MAAGLIVQVGLLVSLSGCNNPSPTNPTTLAPGYYNAADQQMGEILSGAHAFYLSVQQQSAAGTLKLSATAKTVFNDFGASLNAADSVYLAYHQTPTAANQATAQAAVNVVQTKQAAAQTVATSAVTQ